MRDGDNDIAAALPKAPPPSPASRTAAIEEAMRRFDGLEAAPPLTEQRRSASRWTAFRRPQIAGLVSIALVAMVGMPVAWFAIDRDSAPDIHEKGFRGIEVTQPGPARTPVATAGQSREPLSQPASPQAVPPPSGSAGSLQASGRDKVQLAPLAGLPAPMIAPTPVLIDGNRQSGAAAKPAAGDNAKDIAVPGTSIKGVAPAGTNPSVVSRDDSEARNQTSKGQLSAPAPAPVPAPGNRNAPPNNTDKVAQDSAQTPRAIVRGKLEGPTALKAIPPRVAQRALQRQSAPSAENGEAERVFNFVAPPAPVAANQSAERSNAAGSTDVVVTGATIRGRAAASSARGDWNACTVNDPGKSLVACKTLVNPAAPGPAGRAAAHIADGLTRAWNGDFTGAIAAFDAAITLSPRLAFVYLNRGLAWQHKGDLARAMADLNQAVNYAPGAARGYYNRSIILRQRGDPIRADTDEQRAVDLDPDYEALLR